MENLVKQCDGLEGEITTINYDSRRIRLENRDYMWRPVCDRVSIRIFMEHTEKTVEIAMSGMVLWKIGDMDVSGAALEVESNGLVKLVLRPLPERSADPDVESYFIVYEMAWRFTENPQIYPDSGL